VQDLVAFLSELHALRITSKGVNTSTPAGKALSQMMGVFAEFERAMIRERGVPWRWRRDGSADQGESKRIGL
jgi:DNA invertase Pin-like site-specific DNA recombinase